MKSGQVAEVLKLISRRCCEYFVHENRKWAAVSGTAQRSQRGEKVRRILKRKVLVGNLFVRMRIMMWVCNRDILANRCQNFLVGGGR